MHPRLSVARNDGRDALPSSIEHWKEKFAAIRVASKRRRYNQIKARPLRRSLWLPIFIIIGRIPETAHVVRRYRIAVRTRSGRRAKSCRARCTARAAKVDLKTGANGAGKGAGEGFRASKSRFDPEGLVQGDICLRSHRLRTLRGAIKDILKPRFFDGERGAQASLRSRRPPGKGGPMVLAGRMRRLMKDRVWA